MNHQRISFWLSLVFAVACGGGDGPPVEVDATPDQIPPNSDQPPPASPDQPPPSPDYVGGGSTPGGGGGGNGGGSCGAACAQAVARGCETSQDECVALCNHPSDLTICMHEQQELVLCGLRTYCPEDQAADIETTCPAEYTALLTCAAANQ